MKRQPPHIIKARRQLMLSLVVVLSLPAALGLYLWHLILENTRFIGSSFIPFVVILLTPVGVGILLGIFMLLGKKWAFNLWNGIVTALGLIVLALGLFMLSVFDINETQAFLILTFLIGIGFLILAHRNATSSNISLFFESQQVNIDEDIIDQIGKRDD